MRIVAAALPSREPDRASDFLRSVLGLPRGSNPRRMQAGWTDLLVLGAPLAVATQHFAFTIARGRLAAAKDHLRAQGVALLERDGRDEFEFESWAARAIYFLDPTGNVVELIERRRLENGEPTNSAGAFSSKDILCMSEIGFVVQSVRRAGDVLARDAGLPVFGKPTWDGPDAFAAMGDDEGLCILSASGRAWFPTDTKAKPNEATATLQVEGRPWVEILCASGEVGVT